MRLDSPFALAVAGTLAIHVLAVTAGDALVVTRPPRAPIPAPRIELVEVEVPPVLQPPPPPVKTAPEPVVENKPAPRPRVARTLPSREPPPPPPPNTPEPPPSGGDEVVQMENIAPSATGVAVAAGKPATGHLGRGGTGGGTGSGVGTGTGDAPPRPVSVATIKTSAMPRGDQSYFGIGKDYPAEALALGIEGAIRVQLVVDDRGKVTSSRLLNKLGHGLDEIALKRAAELEFEPARDTDDKPVASIVVWTFTMTLPK